MNIGIIIYMAIGIIWALLMYMAAWYLVEKKGEVDDATPIGTFLCALICIMSGALWIITMPFTIAKSIGRDIAKKSTIK